MDRVGEKYTVILEIDFFPSLSHVALRTIYNETPFSSPIVKLSELIFFAMLPPR